jgi:hypothetical protein
MVDYEGGKTGGQELKADFRSHLIRRRQIKTNPPVAGRNPFFEIASNISSRKNSI